MKKLKVKANEELFNRFNDIILYTNSRFNFLAGIIQNDMEITEDQLEEWDKEVDIVIGHFSMRLDKLRDDIISHIYCTSMNDNGDLD